MADWYLRVKTLNEEHQIDLGADEAVAHAALEEAKKLTQETGAVTIASGSGNYRNIDGGERSAITLNLN